MQRGTDRTAAELAIVRLEKEIEVAKDSRDKAILMLNNKTSLKSSTRYLASGGTFLITWIVAVFLGPKEGMWAGIWSLVAFLGALALGAWVAVKTRVPDEELIRVTGLWDTHLKKLKTQLAENHAVANGRPS